MQFAQLKGAVEVVAARGQELLRQERQEAAQVYETLLLTLHTLLGAEDDLATGWERAALVFTDTQRRLPPDILQLNNLRTWQLRAAALRDLPQIGTVASLDDIHTTIAGAIAIGAPRYNLGDVLGCCTIYWATIQALIVAPVPRGFQGNARALAPLRAAIEVGPGSATPSGIDAYAWRLRHALDATLQVVG